MILTEEQRNEVVHCMCAYTYTDIYEKIIKGKWTTDMFVYFCRELYKEGEEAASNEACL